MITLLIALHALPNIGEFETKRAARLLRFWILGIDLQAAVAAFAWSYVMQTGAVPSVFMIINLVCVVVQLFMLVYAMIDQERQRAVFDTNKKR